MTQGRHGTGRKKNALSPGRQEYSVEARELEVAIAENGERGREGREADDANGAGEARSAEVGVRLDQGRRGGLVIVELGHSRMGEEDSELHY